jgi:YD repeat-containing protein
MSLQVEDTVNNTVSYKWDEVHNIIERRSAGSSLVVINLPARHEKPNPRSPATLAAAACPTLPAA